MTGTRLKTMVNRRKRWRKGQRLNQGKERGLKGKWENWADFGSNLAGSKQRCLQRS